MLTINLSSIIYFICFLFIWIIDSLLNYILAKRIRAKREFAYFIPLLSYYRFGMLTNLHPLVVGVGLLVSITASLWGSLVLSLQYSISATLLAIIVNTIIITRIAQIFEKTKWHYTCSSIIFGLIGICLQPIILLVLYEYYSYLLIFVLLLLHTIIVQIPKIMLIMTTNTLNKEIGSDTNSNVY